MNNIEEVFKGNIKRDSEQIMKNICGNWTEKDWHNHACGVENIARYLEPKFVITEHNKPILKLLLLYFTGNELFIKECEKITGNKGSLSKGILLMGDVGVGKSLMFRIFKEYTANVIKSNSFHYHEMLDILKKVRSEGESYLDRFADNLIDNENARPVPLYIDDIASKNEDINDYGTKSNVGEDISKIRYNVFIKYRKVTHGSTNLYPGDLENTYDIRVCDRFKEMYNLIALNGKSFRG